MRSTLVCNFLMNATLKAFATSKKTLSKLLSFTMIVGKEIIVNRETRQLSL